MPALLHALQPGHEPASAPEKDICTWLALLHYVTVPASFVSSLLLPQPQCMPVHGDARGADAGVDAVVTGVTNEKVNESPCSYLTAVNFELTLSYN